MTEKSQIIEKDPSKVWNFINQLDNWVTLIDDCEIAEKEGNTCTITKRVKAGFIKINLHGTIVLNVVDEGSNLILKIDLKSKVVETATDISVRLEQKETSKTLMNASTKLSLSGTMAEMAKPLAEKVFVNILDNMFQKLSD